MPLNTSSLAVYGLPLKATGGEGEWRIGRSERKRIKAPSISQPHLASSFILPDKEEEAPNINMQSVQELFQIKEKPKSKAGSERAALVEQFVLELKAERDRDNIERFTKENLRRHKKGEQIIDVKDWKKQALFLKAISPRFVGFKLAHLGMTDLYHFLSVCRDYKNRNGSFGKMFWGSLKIR